MTKYDVPIHFRQDSKLSMNSTGIYNTQMMQSLSPTESFRSNTEKISNLGSIDLDSHLMKIIDNKKKIVEQIKSKYILKTSNPKLNRIPQNKSISIMINNQSLPSMTSIPSVKYSQQTFQKIDEISEFEEMMNNQLKFMAELEQNQQDQIQIGIKVEKKLAQQQTINNSLYNQLEEDIIKNQNRLKIKGGQNHQDIPHFYKNMAEEKYTTELIDNNQQTAYQIYEKSIKDDIWHHGQKLSLSDVRNPLRYQDFYDHIDREEYCQNPKIPKNQQYLSKQKSYQSLLKKDYGPIRFAKYEKRNKINFLNIKQNFIISDLKSYINDSNQRVPRYLKAIIQPYQIT